MSSESPIDTRKVRDRRPVSFDGLDDVLADARRFGPDARTTGNWTPSQVVEHVAEFMHWSREGFDVRPPLLLRIAGRLMRPWALRGRPPAGMKLPPKLQRLVPARSVSWDAAITHLEDEVRRIDAGERYTHSSPLFGRLTHVQWVRLHCNHAAHHFSFVHPSEAG